MRLLVCDVCDNNYEPDAEMIGVTVPSYFFDDDSGVSLNLDVCSWECLMNMVEARFRQITKQEESQKEPEEEEEAEDEDEYPVLSGKTIKIRKTEKAPEPPTQPSLPGISFDNMTEKDLDELTSKITGVKRKW